jgi:UDP-glucose 4-epimerase
VKSVLVTGGAGYIGSHMVKLLGERGRTAVVLDDLSTGHRDAVPDGSFVEGDIGDFTLVSKLLREREIGAVMHFSACSRVGESVADPLKYYTNNVAKTLELLRAMRAAGVERLVFSSTAAVYGEPKYTPIDEAHPAEPVNPYGASKLMIERMLDEFCTAYGLRSLSLRYFNAAGADPEGALGERHEPETHLVPLVLQAASGRRRSITVNGTDYPTRDGTCVRDYVHVTDLCEAHLLALDWLEAGGEREKLNLGSGTGATVLEVIEAARRETGVAFQVEHGARRAGDPAVLVASPERARRVLGWTPSRADLATIVRDAWRWEQRRIKMGASESNQAR